jgi:hypothetical protein
MSRSFRTKFPVTHTLTTQYRIDQGLGDLGSDTKRRVPCQGGCGRRFLKLKAARWHYCDQCEQVAVLVSEALDLELKKCVKHVPLICEYCGKFYDSEQYECGCPDSYDGGEHV